MLPKAYRLNLNKQFNWAITGQKIDTDNLRLYLKFGESPHALIGVAISTKYFRKAYQRHQAKRRTFQAIEALYANLPSRLNLVIMPKAAVLKTPIELLTVELAKGLKLKSV